MLGENEKKTTNENDGKMLNTKFNSSDKLECDSLDDSDMLLDNFKYTEIKVDYLFKDQFALYETNFDTENNAENDIEKYNQNEEKDEKSGIRAVNNKNNSSTALYNSNKKNSQLQNNENSILLNTGHNTNNDVIPWHIKLLFSLPSFSKMSCLLILK